MRFPSLYYDLYSVVYYMHIQSWAEVIRQNCNCQNSLLLL